MLQAQAEAIGIPQDVVRCVTVERPALEPGKLRVQMLLASINPADLLQMAGRYGVHKQPPYVPGHEGVGRVIEVGDGVEGWQVGDLVLPSVVGYWREELIAAPKALQKLPPGLSHKAMPQAAMLRANPASAWAMLHTMVALKPGDWVLQNAGNSAVGGFVQQLAARSGIKVLSLVRQPADSAGPAGSSGHVTLADPDPLDPEADAGQRLAQAVLAATGGVAPKLGLDAIGGRATARLAAALANGATVVNYGLLSGKDCELSPQELVFRGLQLRGFWLTTWFQQTAPETVSGMVKELAGLLLAGEISAPVEAIYPVQQVADAVRHAAQPGRQGKVLLHFPAWQPAG